ncbi:transposase [Rhodanobacter sp. B05]|nr:transposase [Rhodanobacter sp. B05]
MNYHFRSPHHAEPGPRTTYRYTHEFKATAVRLSQLSGVAVQDVAASLYIHPFMLSRWRKQAREGVIMTKGVAVDKAVAAELKELRRVKKAYEQLKIEHDLLKKAIAFTSARKVTSSPSSNSSKSSTP